MAELARLVLAISYLMLRSTIGSKSHSSGSTLGFITSPCQALQPFHFSSASAAAVAVGTTFAATNAAIAVFARTAADPNRSAKRGFKISVPLTRTIAAVPLSSDLSAGTLKS